MIAATKEANELERKRRLAWEQEQEAKHTQREAEMERQIVDMRQEIASLKAYVAVLPSLLKSTMSGPSAFHQIGAAPATTEPPSAQLLSPVSQRPDSSAHVSGFVQHSVHPLSPISQPPSRAQPLFVEGSSTRPLVVEHDSEFIQDGRDTVAESSPSVFSSPRFRPTQPPSRGTEAPSTIPRRRRRDSPEQEADGDDEGSDAESSDGHPERPLKRTNHRDTRILTVQVSSLA